MTDEALILAILQRLRRYARLLTGDQHMADEAVARALVSAFKQPCSDRDQLKCHFFEHFSYVWSPAPTLYSAPELHVSAARDADNVVTTFDRRLQALSPLSRQVFLLTAVEQFSDQHVARILGLSATQLRNARSRSRWEMARLVRSNILIIEDDLFTATNISDSMLDVGHHVVGVAASHERAVELAALNQVDVILADVELPNGGSGIAAVSEICSIKSVPAIYITAFPERLKASSPAIARNLVAKPFKLEQIHWRIVEQLFVAPASGLTG